MDFNIPTTTAASELAAVVGASVTSVWVLVILAIGIPLSFYILHRVIGLFPKAGGRR